MADKSKIEWTEATWNVVTGCSRVSEGCRNCYAERLAATRMAHLPAYAGLAEMTPAGPRWTGVVRFNTERLDLPLRWRRPRMIFVNSQSDLFHESLPFEQITAIFGVMAACPQHVFQVLTKRPERTLEWFGWLERAAVAAKRDFFPSDGLDWTRQHVMRAATLRTGMAFPRGRSHVGMDAPWPLPNVWLGVSAEDQATADARIPLLLDTPAAVRWVSAEPLLGPIDLARWAYLPRRVAGDWPIGHKTQAGPGIVRGKVNPLGAWCVLADDGSWLGVKPGEFEERRLDWVVVGGESGPGARAMHPDWARQIRNQCVAAGTAYFFKQWGEWRPLGALDLMEDADTAAIMAADMERTIAVYPDGSTDPEGAFGLGGYYVERVGKRAAGRLLDGRTWDDLPAAKVVPA